MADPLDRLKAEMKAATPEIRADAKARALAEAQKIFAARQESERDARLRKESPQEPGRFSQGVKAMFMSLTSRGGMVATTALVAVGLFAFAPGMPNLFVPQEADYP